MKPQHVVFVCTGNICRSPTAHAVLRQRIKVHGLAHRLSVASAGLEAWHAGEGPDSRSIRHARQRGYEMADLRARPFRREEFITADWVLVMDEGHLARCVRLCPPQHAHKLRLLTDFCRVHEDAMEVPDPYYGQAADFEHVLDLIEDACDGFLAHLGLAR
ncbi:MAG: low molecular weight phosphotyrosine protein phosphatase [Burkholderiales bacterium]|nr:low molecular weight phosphotyrosine protein phosphatase [Burkholderiales bacterium]